MRVGHIGIIHQRFAPLLDVAVPAVAGLLMGMVIGNLSVEYRHCAVSAAQIGQQWLLPVGDTGERPSDGKVLKVSGPIRVTGPTLRAPLSDRPAVLYNYDISHVVASSRKGNVRTVGDYLGLALTPAVIDSATERFGFLVFPPLDQFPNERQTSSEKAKGYCQNASFTT